MAWKVGFEALHIFNIQILLNFLNIKAKMK